MVMVNTDSGASLFNDCSESIVSTAWDFNDFVRRNEQLRTPMQRHPNRDLFSSLYTTEGFQKAVTIALSDDIHQIKRNQRLSRLSKFIYRFPGMRKLYKLLKTNG